MRPSVRKTFERTACTLAMVFALAGCLEGKKISDIDAPAVASPIPSGPVWIVPAGVSVAAARHGAAVVDGLYPTTDPTERCCWLATVARITLAAPHDATHADLAFLVPQYPFFDARPQALELRVGTMRLHVPELGPGVHRVTIDLPRDGARTSLEIRAERAFSPAREGVNTDSRDLGIVLLSIAYR